MIARALIVDIFMASWQKLSAAESSHDVLSGGQIVAEDTKKLLYRSFQTSQMFSSWADLMWYLSQVTEGHIIAMTIRRSGVVGLRYARDLLTSLGSEMAKFLGPLSMWTWMSIKGGKTLAEALIQGMSQPRPAWDLSSTSLHSEVVIPLSTLPPPSSDSHPETARWKFCNSFGAMGGLCDEVAPDSLRWPSPTVEGLIGQVPVILAAGRRPQYLYHGLHQLLRIPGGSRRNIHAMVGSDASASVLDLLAILDIETQQLPTQCGEDNHQLFQFYRKIFESVLERFPTAPAVIFLDEDVYLSPDFFNFMNQTIPVLLQDPTLYCVNGYSDLVKASRSRGPGYLRRGSVQVSWGFAVTPSFIAEALRLWPKDSRKTDILTYDYWLYRHVGMERECLFPEISRTRHYGLGVNTELAMHEYNAWKYPLLEYHDVSLVNLHELVYEDHEANVLADFEKARVLSLADPFSAAFPPRPRNNEPLVLYFAKNETEDMSTWYLLGTWVGLKAFSEQGHHKGAYVAYFACKSNSTANETLETEGLDTKLGNSSENIGKELNEDFPLHNYGTTMNLLKSFIKVYFVGVPWSDYKNLMPISTQVYNLTDVTNSIKISGLRAEPSFTFEKIIQLLFTG